MNIPCHYRPFKSKAFWGHFKFSAFSRGGKDSVRHVKGFEVKGCLRRRKFQNIELHHEPFTFLISRKITKKNGKTKTHDP